MARRSVAVCGVLALLALPAGALSSVRAASAPRAVQAQEASRHVVRGAGSGHGVGMSQHGALGQARRGRTFRQILAHYYPGTSLAPAGARTVRVLLASGAPEAVFSGGARAGSRTLVARASYRVRRAGSGVELRTARGVVLARSAGAIRVSGAAVRLLGRAANGVTGGRYRGALELRPAAGGGVMVVNALPLDAYVAGVVAGEVPPSWPDEALRAQVVAARSYGLATDAGGRTFDQYADTRSQLYRGIAAEHPRTSAAVRATAGQVLRHGSGVATTFFFSSSGGRTESIENVYAGARATPYLVSVPDPLDAGAPRHRWRLSFTQAEMQSRLGTLVKGSFREVRVTRRGLSPRIVSAEVVGTRGTSPVRGDALRARLGLPSTWAYFSSSG